MTAATITIFSLLTLLFLIVGGLVGFTVSEQLNARTMPYMHPEMYDHNGNIIPDEILAVRFENDYDTDEIEEDDD